RHTRSKRDWSSDVCSSDLPDALKYALRFTIRVADGIGEREAHILMHPGYKTDDIVSVYLHKNGNKYHVYAKINDDIPQVVSFIRSEERRVGKECSTRRWTY